MGIISRWEGGGYGEKPVIFVYFLTDKCYNIKQAVMDFFKSAYGNNQETIFVKTNPQSFNLNIGGSANMVVYIGHNGLMDFQLETKPVRANDTNRDAIILACISESYFSEPLKESGTNPILFTTGLMAPEAYTLKSAIDGWVLNESREEIRLRAAEAYHQYQKCGLNAAKNLFVAGW